MSRGLGDVYKRQVLFMQDYQDSRGAMLEWAWCQYVGKQTCYDLAVFGGGDNA